MTARTDHPRVLLGTAWWVEHLERRAQLQEQLSPPLQEGRRPVRRNYLARHGIRWHPSADTAPRRLPLGRHYGS